MRPALLAPRLGGAGWAVAGWWVLALAAFADAPPADRRSDAVPRLLVLALDAVPFDTVAALADPGRGDEALFRDFAPPVPLISTFPSTSSPAFAGLLAEHGITPTHGYEARFYDLESEEVRGGGWRSYERYKPAFRRFFDWKVETILAKMLQGARPRRAAIQTLVDGLDAFFASDEPVFFVYQDATDLIGHLHGPEALGPTLAFLDAELARRRAAAPRPFHTVLFSDHGNNGGRPLANVLDEVSTSLRDAGYRLGRSRRSADVVIIRFGLLSSFAVVTRPGLERAVASRLASVGGVDLCACRRDDGWWVVSARGAAMIRHRDGPPLGGEWSYLATSGDPLELNGIVAQLGGVAPSLGPTWSWFADANWLAATAGHHYPDPLYRIARAFDVVENPASVICSLRLGYMFGAGTTETMARLTRGRLRYTHGALDRDASYGFLLTDLPGWRPTAPLRFADALAPVAARLADEADP